MTLQEIVSGFPTTPFLFAGSGVSRRYYDLPDWKNLLLHFAKKVRGEDELAFRYYENELPSDIAQEDRMPMIAGLIEKDYNAKWFQEDGDIGSGLDTVYEQIREGVTPFKAEVASYLLSESIQKQEYKTEIEKLERLTKRNLSGIITTNYDTFFESICDDYKVFVGQDELVFSQIQGIAEIYKIHGSADSPGSIVINQEDYRAFRDKGKYLAAKLMTIFMEYPIIFIGYSLSDPDILSIMEDVVVCLPEYRIKSLESRFVFVEYEEGKSEVEIASHTMVVNGNLISMTKVVLSDFGLLYDALSLKKAAFPVKILRRFKDELYSFVLTSKQRTTMRVAELDDGRINEETLALTIGGLESTGKYGLAMAVDADQWYRNIVLNDLDYSADDMLQLAYPGIAKRSSWNLPVWYYITNSQKKENCILAIEKGAKSYSDLVSEREIKRNKSAVKGRDIKAIWTAEKNDLKRAIRILSHLPEESVDVDELESILKEIFLENREILGVLESPNRSMLRKMIRIYDFLKYKTP